MTKKDTVAIHGKDYETVASRVNRFRQDPEHKDLAIRTALVTADAQYVIIKASIVDIVKNNDDAKVGEFVLATGYAEEKRNSTTINKTSALENCETSAIGRALAAFGYAGTEYASADEMTQAVSQQTKQTYTQPVENNVDNVDPETFKDLCFLGKNLDLDKDQTRKVWNYAWEIGRYTRGKYDPDSKAWTGTHIPTDALRPILTAFAKEANQDPNVILAQFGINALSDIKSVDDFSDEPF